MRTPKSTLCFTRIYSFKPKFVSKILKTSSTLRFKEETERQARVSIGMIERTVVEAVAELEHH